MLCEVCSDIANGVHFGVPTCEGCKVKFHLFVTWERVTILIECTFFLQLFNLARSTLQFLRLYTL